MAAVILHVVAALLVILVCRSTQRRQRSTPNRTSLNRCVVCLVVPMVGSGHRTWLAVYSSSFVNEEYYNSINVSLKKNKYSRLWLN